MLKSFFRTKCVILFLLALSTAVVLLMLLPLPQNPQYHHFADGRTFFGITNALNVISNIPFLIVGILGLLYILRNNDDYSLFYSVFFFGIFLVCVGSSYYHLHPDNNRLVWDRLPMTVAFMALFSAIIGERISFKFAKLIVIPLLLLGASSVLYWHYTQLVGNGDLRFYVFIQFFPMLAIPYLLLVFPPKYSDVHYLWLSLIAYLLAKICELYDRPIYDLTHQCVSGHTIKHLLAAISSYYIYCYLKKRRKL